MDSSNLIDLSSPCGKTDARRKIESPLIPIPHFDHSAMYVPRLSDVDNTPFDKILRSLTNKDDPFERVLENAGVKQRPTMVEEKENISHLISPFQTPTKPRKSRKITSDPLYLSESHCESPTFKHADSSLLPRSVIDLQNASNELNATDASLQCLSESLLNTIDANLEGSFNAALNIPLPESPEELQESECSNCTYVPSIVFSNGNSQSNSGISALNNAFVDSDTNRTRILSSVSSRTRISFHSDSLGNMDISNIYPSVSSTRETSGQGTLDRAFLKNSADLWEGNGEMFPKNSADLSEGTGEMPPECQRKCMSALKLKRSVSLPDAPGKPLLNNSFAGFNLNSRAEGHRGKQSTGFADDSVFLEATNLAHAFSRLANGSDDNLEDENLYVLCPPWLQEHIDFCENENPEHPQETPVPAVTPERTPDGSPVEAQKLSVSVCSEDPENDTSDMKNAKNLLHNLTEILKCDGDVVNQRKLGENLLNSLALALNLEKPNFAVCNPVEQEPEVLNGPSAEDERRLEISPKQCESIAVVPKIKTRSMRASLAPARIEKSLKVKPEKGKATAKGPLKAVIPVNNMAKKKRSVASKSMPGSTTPPKALQIPSAFQVKKTSTPYELKIKAPIAQSTPDSHKPNQMVTDKGTPVTKRPFKYSLSPLARPASTGDLSCLEAHLNKSLSPRDASGSVPHVNKQTSPRDANGSISHSIKPVSPRDAPSSSLNKSVSSIGKPAMGSFKGGIPMSRRKSASDVKSANNVLNKSYESSNKPARPTLLKRSSSFQNKAPVAAAASSTKVENNNTYKKFGAPGNRLKALCLLKKKTTE